MKVFSAAWQLPKARTASQENKQPGEDLPQKWPELPQLEREGAGKVGPGKTVARAVPDPQLCGQSESQVGSTKGQLTPNRAGYGLMQLRYIAMNK